MKPVTIAACWGVEDTQATCDWYEKLGFQALPAGDEPGDDIRILLYEGEFALMVYDAGQLRDWLPVLRDTPVGCSGMFYLSVDDVDAAVEAFGPHVEAVKDAQFQGERLFYFRDLNGYVVGLAKKQDRCPRAGAPERGNGPASGAAGSLPCRRISGIRGATVTRSP